MIQDGGKWMRVQSSDFGKVKPPSSRVDLGVFRTVGFFTLFRQRLWLLRLRCDELRPKVIELLACGYFEKLPLAW